jgi:hypothetical protein
MTPETSDDVAGRNAGDFRSAIGGNYGKELNAGHNEPRLEYRSAEEGGRVTVASPE